MSGIKQGGFTLIEMAVVLVIMGLILGSIISYTTSVHSQGQLTATITREQAIKIGLINFLARNHRLPCPAVPTIVSGNAGYGQEDTPGSTPATACAASNPVASNTAGVQVVTGIVPWASLGISDEGGTDGYNNRFAYQVVQSATYTSLTAQTVAGIKGDISLHLPTTALPTATLGPPPTGNQSNYCIPPTSTSTYNSCAAVAIIISYGNDGLGAYTNAEVHRAMPAAGTDEAENTNGDAKFIMKDYVDNSANPFDDIVLPLTVDDLVSPLTLNGSVQSSNALVGNAFANIEAVVTARLINAGPSGGAAGSYTYTMPATLDANIQAALIANPDPWGNVITYTPNPVANAVSCTGNTNAFTLTSNGPDGVNGTTDDITINYVNYQLAAPLVAAGKC